MPISQVVFKLVKSKRETLSWIRVQNCDLEYRKFKREATKVYDPTSLNNIYLRLYHKRLNNGDSKVLSMDEVTFTIWLQICIFLYILVSFNFDLICYTSFYNTVLSFVVKDIRFAASWLLRIGKQLTFFIHLAKLRRKMAEYYLWL